MAAEEKPQEEPSAAAGGCVLAVVSGTALAGVAAVSTEAAVLTVWGVGTVLLWRAARRRTSDSSATPPPGGAAPSESEEADQTLGDGTTLVRREGMLIYRRPDPKNPHRTLVRVERLDEEDMTQQ